MYVPIPCPIQKMKTWEKFTWVKSVTNSSKPNICIFFKKKKNKKKPKQSTPVFLLIYLTVVICKPQWSMTHETTEICFKAKVQSLICTQLETPHERAVCNYCHWKPITEHNHTLKQQSTHTSETCSPCQTAFNKMLCNVVQVVFKLIRFLKLSSKSQCVFMKIKLR